MKRKITSMILTFGMAVALLSGCGQGTSDTGNAEKTTASSTNESDAAASETENSDSGEAKTIAIVPWDMAETFAVDFSHEAQEMIEAKGWKAVIMDPKGDWAQEYTIIENLTTQGVDGIIYTAIDADGANDLIEEVRGKGVAIVGYDCLSSEGVEDAAVRYDDEKGGEMAAEQAMKALV